MFNRKLSKQIIILNVNFNETKINVSSFEFVLKIDLFNNLTLTNQI